MRKNYIFFFFLLICSSGLYAQTLEEAKQLFKDEQYEKAKPVFKKYVKTNPGNASYNHWYGACCYETGEKEIAEKYLLIGAKKNVQESFRYLGQLYSEQYKFDEASSNYESYLNLLKKDKKPTEKFEKEANLAKAGARMIKGVEEVCIIDSFVVNKEDFLNKYKISEEAGQLLTYNSYFQTTDKNEGIVYQTELGNKIYYGSKAKGGNLNIYTKSKLLDTWSEGAPLSGTINTSGKENFPYVLTDGATIYYASDGNESMGGYDIFVSRYNTATDSYLTPDNVGMPFNSPYNDYMYVIDEYNNLGWFASDRFQPAGKVCIYVFIPTTSKQTYNYETTDPFFLRRVAQIKSLKETWKDKEAVKEAKERLKTAIEHKPTELEVHDFEFIIDDNTTYTKFEDFKSPKAQELFKEYQQTETNLEKLSDQLNTQRNTWSHAGNEVKKNNAQGLLDLEKRVEKMEEELQAIEINVRNEEKIFTSK